MFDTVLFMALHQTDLRGTAPLVRTLPAGFTTGSAIAAAAQLSAPGVVSRLQLSEELAGLLPHGRLRPGSCVGIGGGPGQTSLLLRLLAGPMANGCWAAVIGLPDLGIEAAIELGVPLDRLALVPAPNLQWLDVTAALLDSVELVVLNPPNCARPSDARRLMARARQRQSVLIVLDGDRQGGLAASTSGSSRTIWPEQPDLALYAEGAACTGISRGHGSLRARQLHVTTGGRRTGSAGNSQICAERIDLAASSPGESHSGRDRDSQIRLCVLETS